MSNQEEKKYCVYKLTSPEGKIYIGMSSNIKRRWDSYKNYKNSSRLYEAILKFKWENIQKEVLVTGLTKEEASKQEDLYIKLFNTMDPNIGYNCQAGGARDYHRQLSEKLLLVKRKQIINLQTLEIFKSVKECAENYSCSSGLISLICQGKAKRRDDLPLAFLTDFENHSIPEFIPKTNGKPVICVETGDKYPSVISAANACGVYHTAISHACTGASHTCGGYHWKFVEE